MRSLQHIASAALLCAPALCATIDVPGDFALIQDAITAAQDGDTVLVNPGTYHEHEIDYLRKAIVVTGVDPDDPEIVATTVVDGDSAGSVFVFSLSVDTTSVLAGLTVTGGIAEYGGGIRCEGAFGAPLIDRCVVRGNAIPHHLDLRGGGGIYCGGQRLAIIRGCVISDNYAARTGGGIEIAEGARARIEDTRIERNSAGRGGGIHIEGAESSLEIYRCTIVENEAFDGGGINGSVTRADSCEIQRNTAHNFGGGFLGCEIWATHCLFEGNYSGIDGGGISVCDGFAPTIFEDCSIVGNGAESGGGGVWAFWADPILARCDVRANTAAYGAAIGCGQASLELANCTVTENRASEDGAALWFESHLFGGVIASISGTTISANRAGGAGGAIYAEEHDRDIDIDIEAVDLRDNFADGDGGAVFCLDAAIDLVGCILTGNSSGGKGGAIHVAGEASPSVQLASCTVTENEAAVAGGALFVDAGSWRTESDSAPIAAIGSIFWANQPDEFLGDGIVTRYCDVLGGRPGLGNIDADPRFTSFHGVDLLLAPASPCIDTGPPFLADDVPWPPWYRNDPALADMGAFGGPGAALRWPE
ncbi:MAG: hypothetical protein CME06_12585 [Gemmatimonadetes bacterium]|nr:hypothetical protein [Gemmatimonadota bacterium]